MNRNLPTVHAGRRGRPPGTGKYDRRVGVALNAQSEAEARKIAEMLKAMGEVPSLSAAIRHALTVAANAPGGYSPVIEAAIAELPAAARPESI